MKKKNWYLTIGCVLTACMLIFIATGFLWTPYEPSAMNAADRGTGPCAQHLFGCDSYGRDIFSRTLEGAGSTLTIGPGKYNVIGALGVLFIPSFARLVRGEFLKYRDRDFVISAKLMGVSDCRIIFVHILPNTWPVLLSGLTIGFNNAVLAEASMSYLGIGVSAQEPSIGYMLKDAQAVLFTLPWCTVFPALVAVLLILGMGLLGEGLRDRMGVVS